MGKERERERARDRERYHPRNRSHSREREPRRHNRDRERERRDRRSRSSSRSKSRSPRRSPIYMAGPSGKPEETPPQELTVKEVQMQEVLGFASFHSTKGKKVEGKNVGAVKVSKKRKYRQYMNRKGGFNRPLDFVD